MISFLTATENLPFTTALGVMLVLGFMEAVFTLRGFGFSHLFDNLHLDGGNGAAAPDLDLDGSSLEVHHGFDLEKAAPVFRLLDWLHVGKVPIMVVFVVFLTVFGLVGLSLQWVLLTGFERMLPALA